MVDKSIKDLFVEEGAAKDIKRILEELLNFIFEQKTEYKHKFFDSFYTYIYKKFSEATTQNINYINKIYRKYNIDGTYFLDQYCSKEELLTLHNLIKECATLNFILEKLDTLTHLDF